MEAIILKITSTGWWQAIPQNCSYACAFCGLNKLWLLAVSSFSLTVEMCSLYATLCVSQ